MASPTQPTKVLSPQLPRATAPYKRIIVCCDGTWQDGLVQKKRWQFSNVLKLARTLKHEDDRHHPAIPQVVFYQTGIGSEENFYAEYIEGPTGASLVQKIQEAYAFISQNYKPGDEIFLFGFSRGAYTARMCAALIGEFGVLDKRDMDHFPEIFVAYQTQGKTENEKEKAEAKKYLERYTNPSAKGRLRADPDGDKFTIKCVGVWDTVGSLGLPKELTLTKKVNYLFGFPDTRLGTHIQHAFHAMALNETRADFDVTKWKQTEAGRDKGQTLKQVWFAGSHSDVGGGWQLHDLSDLALVWMSSNIQDMLGLDMHYLCGLPRPVAPWGTQLPHNPQTGIFKMSATIQRVLPTETKSPTYEYIHPSVQSQELLLPDLAANIKHNPALVDSLAALEKTVKDEWNYVPGQKSLHGKEATSELESQEAEKKELLSKTKDAATKTETVKDESGKPRYEESWLASIIHALL